MWSINSRGSSRKKFPSQRALLLVVNDQVSANKIIGHMENEIRITLLYDPASMSRNMHKMTFNKMYGYALCVNQLVKMTDWNSTTPGYSRHDEERRELRRDEII